MDTRIKLFFLLLILVPLLAMQKGSIYTSKEAGSEKPVSLPLETKQGYPAVVKPDMTDLEELRKEKFSRRLLKGDGFDINEVDSLSDQEINIKYNREYFLKLLRKTGCYKDEYNLELDWRNAVLRYQSWNNLVVDGVFTVELKRMLLKGIIKGGPDILPRSTPRGWWITINKTRRTLTIYKDRKVYRKCPISPGRQPSFTPEGKFTIVNKYVNPAWGNHGRYVPGGHPNNPLGKRWMGLSPDGGNTYGIHGSNLPYSIGTDGSAGCIRMINSEVEEVYEFIPKGTEVWIGTDRKLTDWGIKAEPSR